MGRVPEGLRCGVHAGACFFDGFVDGFEVDACFLVDVDGVPLVCFEASKEGVPF